MVAKLACHSCFHLSDDISVLRTNSCLLIPVLGSVEVGFFTTVQYTGQKLARFQVSHGVKQSTGDSEKQETALKSVTVRKQGRKNYILLNGPGVVKRVLVQGAGCSSLLGYFVSAVIVLQWLGPCFVVHSSVRA